MTEAQAATGRWFYFGGCVAVLLLDWPSQQSVRLQGELGFTGQGILNFAKPARKLAGLASLGSNFERARNELLSVYPDYLSLFKLGMFFLEFSRRCAERNGLRLREIRRRPFALSRGITPGAEDVLPYRHGSIRCVRRVIRRRGNIRFSADRGTATG